MGEGFYHLKGAGDAEISNGVRAFSGNILSITLSIDSTGTPNIFDNPSEASIGSTGISNIFDNSLTDFINSLILIIVFPFV